MDNAVNPFAGGPVFRRLALALVLVLLPAGLEAQARDSLAGFLANTRGDTVAIFTVLRRAPPDTVYHLDTVYRVDTVTIPGPAPASAGVDTLRWGPDSALFTAWHLAKVTDSTWIVRVAPPPVTKVGRGLGAYGLTAVTWSARSPLNVEVGSVDPSNIASRIDAAIANKSFLVLAATGGAHANYMTNGVFDHKKWSARLQLFDTPTIRAAVQRGAAAGAVLGFIAIDEPFNTGIGVGNAGNSWGPAGTITKAIVDSMCLENQKVFPGVPVGATHDAHDFEPTKLYKNCDTRLAQYRWTKTKGDIVAWRNAELAMAASERTGLIFSLNVLHGGQPGTPCPSGMPYDNLCAMTPAQVKAWGLVLGTAGCAIVEWRYDGTYHTRADVKAAHQAIADSVRKLPARSCGRPT